MTKRHTPAKPVLACSRRWPLLDGSVGIQNRGHLDRGRVVRAESWYRGIQTSDRVGRVVDIYRDAKGRVLVDFRNSNGGIHTALPKDLRSSSAHID